MWHFVFLTVRGTRFSILNAALAIFQVVLLLLAIKMRGSAEWMVLFVVAAAIYMAWRRQRTKQSWSWTGFGRSLVQWPVIVLLGGLIGNAQYMNAKLHPSYFTDDAVPLTTPFGTRFTSDWYGRMVSPKSWHHRT